MNAPTEPDPRHAFYVSVMETLDRIGIPFLVGGTFAFEHYTGIRRETKDFDLFLRPEDVSAAVDALTAHGFDAEVKFTHWLGKVHGPDEELIDLIFSSGNGVCPVDDTWFAFAPRAEILGRPARLMPPEEMIWQKSFILERDRCDVADVAHVVQRWGHKLDWDRLVERFGDHADVLLAQLVLFRYAFPADVRQVPDEVWERLLRRGAEVPSRLRAPLCRGTLFSYGQFSDDLGRGYVDARLPPHGAMHPHEVDAWVGSFQRKKNGQPAKEAAPPPRRGGWFRRRGRARAGS